MNSRQAKFGRSSRRLKNRLRAILCHVPTYSGNARSRLAAEVGVSTYTIKRLLAGSQPDHALLMRIAEVISGHLGRPFDVREIAVPIGESFPTEHPCDLFGCACTPPWAYTAAGTLKPEFEGVPPGKWTFAVPAADESLST